MTNTISNTLLIQLKVLKNETLQPIKMSALINQRSKQMSQWHSVPCMTPQNIDEPWILYKSFHAAADTGFLRVKGQKLRKSRYCVITFRVKPPVNLSQKYVHETFKENAERLRKRFYARSLKMCSNLSTMCLISIWYRLIKYL